MNFITATATDIGSGYKALPNNIKEVYSMELLFQAEPVLRFQQFVQQKTELLDAPGLTINFTKYSNLSEGDEELTEHVEMETEALESSRIQISVTEYGKAVGVSNKLLKASFTNTMQDASILLGRNYGHLADRLARETYLSSLNTVFPGTKTAINQLTATDLFDTDMVKDGVEILRTNNAYEVVGQYYVCFLHPHQSRGLKDDSEWISANKYAGSRNIFLGETGMYDNVIFIETTVMPVLTGSAVVDVYQAVLFGEYAVGYAVGLPVEMRDNGIQDFQRKRAIAHYGMYGSGILTTENIVILYTA
jgi:N4-gp56 family major capsid protein